MKKRIGAALLSAAGLVHAQGWRLQAPESAQAGDVVALRLTRDGAPQGGATVRVAAPAREVASVRAAAAEIREAPLGDSEVKGTLYRGDSVLVTVTTNAGEWCGVQTGWGLSGHVLCVALVVRAYGQPIGTTDADGRVLSRDLALVPATVELVAERAGEALASATLVVKPDEFDFTSPLAPGVSLREKKVVRAGDGIFTVRALEIDPAAPHLFLLPARANDRASGVETASNLARRFGALAAVNGAPFIASGPYAGTAAGAYQWNGRVLAGGGGPRSALLLCDPRSTRRADIDVVELRGRVTAPSGRSIDLRSVNRPRSDTDDLVLYTPALGPRTLTGPGGAEAILDPQNRVNDLREADSEIPGDGAVLSGSGAAAAFLREQATAGSALRIETEFAPMTTPAISGCQAVDIIGAGPGLVEEGRAAVRAENAADENVRVARTAFALTDRNTWLLVTVDGRQAASAGMRLAELAEELVRLGALRAVALDGGASTTMVANDVVRNQPSAGEEIPVGDALLLFSVQDLAGLRYLVDRVTNEPFQVPFDVREQIQTALAAAFTAVDEGDPAALRAAMEKLRNDLLRMSGRELPAAPGRVLLRAVETFMVTLAPIQRVRDMKVEVKRPGDPPSSPQSGR